MITVLVACKEPKRPEGLEHLGVEGVDWRIAFDTGAGWGAAANRLLDNAVGDCLFCDDDVAFTPDSLAGVRAHRGQADVFGLDLHDLRGQRQVGARHVLTPDGAIVDWVQSGPAYVAHCSTSAIYLTAPVVRAVRFPIWPGLHWEDVAFCFDAWAKGFKVLAVPGLVYHAIEQGVGATKRHDAAFWQRWHTNRAAFQQWCAGRDLSAVPVGVREL